MGAAGRFNVTIKFRAEQISWIFITPQKPG